MYKDIIVILDNNVIRNLIIYEIETRWATIGEVMHLLIIWIIRLWKEL